MLRRALRIAAWSLAGVLLLAVLLVGAVLVAGNIPSGRALIERETAQLTSGRVRIAGLGGAFPGAIDIGSLELRDAQGVWMRAEHIAVRWSPLALLGWDLHVERFDIGRVEVTRQPVSTPAPHAQGSSTGTSLPTIDIDELAIGMLDLEPAAAGMQALLTVRGNAHYASLTDARVSLDARRTNGMGRYTVQLRLEPARMNASLELEEPAGGPLEHLVNLPGLGALSVTANLEGPRNAERVRLLARAGDLHADASGTVDLEHRSADLTYAVESPAMMPRADLSWQRIALQGRWRGPLDAANAAGTLDLEGLRVPDGAQLDRLTANLAADGRLLTLRAAADGITLPGPHPQLLQGSPLTLDATLRLDAADRPLRLALKHRLLDLTAEAVTAGARSATFSLKLPDLAPIGALYEQDLTGNLSLSGRVAQRAAATRLDVNATGDLGGSSLAAELLGAKMRLHLAAALAGRTANVESLELNGRALSVSASGSAERVAPGASGGGFHAVQARWRVSLPDLALLSPAMAGTLQATGTASGPSLQSLAADIRMQSKLSIRGSPPGAIEATLQARGLPSAPSGTVRADGTLDGAPLRLDASVQQVRNSVFRVVVKRTEWKSLFINGDLTAGPSLAAGRGSLSLRIGKLSDLERFVGSKLDGRLTGNVALIPAAGRTRMQFELVAGDVAAGGVSGNARLSAAGPIDALRIQVSAQSPSLAGQPASLSTVALLDEPARKVDLEHLEASYRGQMVRLMSPSQVTFANGLRVRDLRLGAQKAVVSVDGEISPALDLRASIQHVDAALVDAFVPNLLAQGTFSADARLRGSRSAPVGRASLEIAGLKLSGDAARSLPAVDVHGSARFQGSTANVSATLHAGAGSQLKMSGLAPLDAAGAVNLKLAGRVDAALANSFLEARGERAAGTVTLDATVTGTAQTPQIGGTIQLANGDVRDYAEGIHLEDIDARLAGGQGILKIESLTARAGPGKLTATGTVGVLQPHMPVKIELTARNIQPITNDILTANLDADVHVAGTLKERTDVTGTIHINRASISIPNAFPPSVAVLDVVRPGQASARSAAASKLVIGLGITLDAPQAIFVQGRGLNAQLGGRLRVAGTSADPRVSGGFTMVRGSFSLAGSELNFTSGRVSFNGEGLKGRIDPTLDFVAQASVTYTAPTTVTLRVTGFADAPKISLSSTPPLPQDDLLGLLLFGKPASQLSAIQLAQIGGGLASLAGAGGGGSGGSSWNPLTWIKNALGLNTFSVGGAGAAGGNTQANGASITAGKYISNKVFVAATQTTTGASQVRVDIDLSRHLKLQTRLGNGTATAQGTTPQNDPGSSIGLSYQFQY